MSVKTLLKKTVSSKFKQFCKHCTLHGVYYFCDSTRWWVHAVWVLILTSSLLLCCYLGHMIWEKFAIDPTLTVVETTQYSTANIPFPAVTVCDAELVHGPNTENISQLLSLRGYNRTQITEFFQSFSELKLKDYNPKSYVKKMHFLLEDLGYPLSALLFLFKKPCEELLLECSWRSRPHNCSQMFRPVYTMMGHCCQFDIAYFKSQVDTKTNFVSGVQPTEALDIIVDGQKVSPDGDYSNGYVLVWIYANCASNFLWIYCQDDKLYVVDPEDTITFINNAVTLSPAAYFDVNVYLWTIASSSYVKALDVGKRRCILDSDPGARSYQGCLVKHIMHKVVNQCKCLPFGFTAKDLNVEAYTTCTWDRLICIHQNIEKVQADIRLVISQNECFQKCDYVQYETEVEFIKNLRSIEGLNAKSSVVVHYSETTCMKYRREVLYTWDQMLANLGGIFGLCLGGSIISVIEIIWFAVDLLFTVINEIIQEKFKAKDKKIAPKQLNANKIFALTQNDLNKTEKKSSVVRIKFAN